LTVSNIDLFHDLSITFVRDLGFLSGPDLGTELFNSVERWLHTQPPKILVYIFFELRQTWARNLGAMRWQATMVLDTSLLALIRDRKHPEATFAIDLDEQKE
jgi:hypothetical protein